jgi:hypothetical protein
MVVPRIGYERAQQVIFAEMCDGPLRPPDARAAARVESIYSLFVPFWRVAFQRTGDADRLTQEYAGHIGVPVEQRGSSDAASAWMVCGRLCFPYEMKHPAAIVVPGDPRPLTLHTGAMVRGDPDPSYGWEVLDADVDEATARSVAITPPRQAALDPSAFFAAQGALVTGVYFVRYPVWFARYRYGGEAAQRGTDLFYVGISAVDEMPITALHPSKLAAGAAKLKKFFGI